MVEFGPQLCKGMAGDVRLDRRLRPHFSIDSEHCTSNIGLLQLQMRCAFIIYELCNGGDAETPRSVDEPPSTPVRFVFESHFTALFSMAFTL